MGYGWEMAKGLLVTLRNMTKKPFTVQYPEERLKQHSRFRGEEFVWYEERCTGCASCAKYCPLGIIKIVTSPSETAPNEGDKYRLEVFDIDISRCMFCGLCVEACPYDALFMGSGFEQGQYSRKEMFIGLDQLRQAEKRPSSFFRPQLEAAEYHPNSGQPLDWTQVGRESWQWRQNEKPARSVSRSVSLDREEDGETSSGQQGSLSPSPANGENGGADTGQEGPAENPGPARG